MPSYLDKDTDPALNPVLQILKDMKRDVRDTKKTVDSINRELGGVQATLDTIERSNVDRDKKVDVIRSDQLSCPAKTGYKSMRMNLQKLEDEIDTAKEITGGYKTIPVGPINSVKEEIPFREIFTKAIPYVILAFVAGAGALAILGYKVFQ